LETLSLNLRKLEFKLSRREKIRITIFKFELKNIRINQKLKF